MTATSDALELARQVRAFQTAAVVVNLALPVMLDPSLPLADYYARVNAMSRADALEMPVDLVRIDGTRNSRRLGAWLQDAVADHGKGLGLGEDLVAFVMIYATTRIEDEVDRLGLRDPQQPLMEFLRHLRNACAHGNRWHLQNGEPRKTATWRQLTVEGAWHGDRAIFGTIGPAEYVDFLEDLAAHLDGLR